MGPGPQRDDGERHEGGDDDHALAAEAFGCRAAGDAAEDGSDVADDYDEADIAGVEGMVFLEEGRVEVLRAVAEGVEGGHKSDEEEEPRPVVDEGLEAEGGAMASSFGEAFGFGC